MTKFKLLGVFVLVMIFFDFFNENDNQQMYKSVFRKLHTQTPQKINVLARILGNNIVCLVFKNELVFQQDDVPLFCMPVSVRKYHRTLGTNLSSSIRGTY